MGRFVVVPAVIVSYCLFHGVLCLCVNVRIPLQLFSLMSPLAWRLSIITDGCASSDWSLGPMLMCVCLGDICVMIGLSLMFLVFFVYVLIRKVVHICFITTLVTASTGVSLSRSLWLCWGDSLSGLSSGSLDGQCSGPSCSCPSLIGCESFGGFSPDSSFLV